MQFLQNVNLIKKNNKLDYYRGKDCLKKFCKGLRKHRRSIIDFEKKELPVLTKEEEFIHLMTEECFICKKNFMMMKKIIPLK